MAYLGFQCLDHPPYSSDLAPSDYHLFPGLKKTIEREVGQAKDLSAPPKIYHFLICNAVAMFNNIAKSMLIICI
jgi:hypothetical protein